MQAGGRGKRWCCLLLLRLRPGGAIPSCCSGFGAETHCWWAGWRSGKNGQSFSETKEYYWWPEANALGNCGVFTGCHVLTAHIYMHWCHASVGQNIGRNSSLYSTRFEVPRQPAVSARETECSGWGWGASGGKGSDKINNIHQEWYHDIPPKLKEDTMPDAMDDSLGEEIIQNIPGTVSGM